ncbi:NADPH2:quinone reductase [Lysinibacillus composti]|uniref:Quinone oxidoreductase n=1 Tax=Lysinibacillus composti TaxID=720633 RepID=A0A3N9UAT5_9BACI|nr:quinone oxidoreductase [Lysinibacillus composti]MBM7609738.1 NADPH2:quinone reductase [Lysinibacillus composti]RQW73659.1 quinone oxidoreductase [Lysinibacillus composti]
MKAVVINEFGGPEVLTYIEVDTPTIESNQVLIRVDATSVNFADIMTRQGKFHAAGKPPIIPGMDATGVIAEVGSEVQNLKVGQRVIAFPKTGSYAEYIVADENLAFVLPENVDYRKAAASPLVSFTSYKLLADVGRLVQGESVLIHAAAGGIGTTAIQLAKILGASRVIGTVGSENKISTALEAGADYVINYEQEDFVEKVNDLTGGKGVDVILDSIGGKVAEKSLDCLAMYGRLVNFGNASGEIGQVKTVDLHSSCRAVLGFSLGTTRNNRPELLRETAERVLEYLADGRLDIKIGNTFSIEEASEAHRLIESRQSVGKMVLEVNK